MWAKWFQKRKIKKNLNLREELDRLTNLYQPYLNTLCLFKGQIVVFLGFKIEEDALLMLFQDNLSVRIGLYKSIDAQLFDFTYGYEEIKKSRMRFLKLKVELMDFGFNIDKIISNTYL